MVAPESATDEVLRDIGSVAPCSIGRRQVFLYLKSAHNSSSSPGTLMTDERIGMFYEDKEQLANLLHKKRISDAIFEAANVPLERRSALLLDVMLSSFAFFGAEVRHKHVVGLAGKGVADL